MSSVTNEITLAEPEVKLEQIMCQMKDLDLISPLISCGLLTVVGQMADYYRDKWYSCSKILDSLTAWLGEKRKTEFSFTQANQATSESRIFEQESHFLRYKVQATTL